MRIVQLSDCHLLSDPDQLFKGVNPADHVQRILKDLSTLEKPADLMVITGDIAHDEKEETYRWLFHQLRNQSIPFQLIPGNHDSPALIREQFGPQGEHPSDGFTTQLNGWSLIGLSTHIPKQEAGRIGKAQLAWCRSYLQAHARSPTLLFLHHPPIDVGSPWIDGIGLEDKALFAELVAQSPQVKAIFCGHVHQDQMAHIAQTPVYTTPSTAMQFEPKTKTTQLSKEPPAYRIIELVEEQVKTSIRQCPIL